MQSIKDTNGQNCQQYLHQKIRNCEQSATLAISQKYVYLQSIGKKIYRFGIGQSPFPVPEVLTNELRKHAPQNGYLAVKGLKKLRKNIADWLNETQKLQFTEEDILIGPGSKQLLFQVNFVLDCEVLIKTPCWVSYIPQAILGEKKVIKIATKYQNGWRLTAEQLQQACEKQCSKQKIKILILNYPDNPTGLTYKEEQLKRLAEVARKHNVIVLSDEIYSKLDFEQNHCSMARFYPEGTIIFSGLSKWVGAGGWRLGFAAFPSNLRWLLQAMAVLASETYTAVSSPIQFAAYSAFTKSEQIQKYSNSCVKILKYLSEWIYQRLTQTKIKTHKPEGGFYIFLDFENYRQNLLKREIKTSAELCNNILEEMGVAVLPGNTFGRNASQLTLRLAFVNFDGAAALAGEKEEEVNENFIKKYCRDTVQGIENLIAWTEKL